MTVGVGTPTLKPLKLKCTASDCENDLHCFLQKVQKPRPHGGPCRSCGKDLVDFRRIHDRSIDDVENTFQALSTEWIRHQFWERPLDQKAVNHARRKGARHIREAGAEKRIRQSVGAARNPREGKQTPYEGNVLYYAQHAVAACCRKCIEYWHGIAMGRALTDEEVGYLSRLLVLFVARRLPDLDDGPVKVPAIRRPKHGGRAHG